MRWFDITIWGNGRFSVSERSGGGTLFGVIGIASVFALVFFGAFWIWSRAGLGAVAVDIFQFASGLDSPSQIYPRCSKSQTTPILRTLLALILLILNALLFAVAVICIIFSPLVSIYGLMTKLRDDDWYALHTGGAMFAAGWALLFGIGLIMRFVAWTSNVCTDTPQLW